MSAVRIPLLALVLLCCAAAARAVDTRYAIDLADRHAQEMTVEARFTDVDAAALDVHLPVWRTGLYLVVDPVGTVSGIEITDGRGRPLAWEQTAKSSWRVDTAGADEVRFRYRIYADSLTDRTRHVDADHAFINPAATLVYADGYRDAPVRIEVELPRGWQLASGMDSPRRGVLVASDYDRLVDSPIEAGTFDLVEFRAAGIDVQFLIHGIWDGDRERLARDVGRLVETTVAVYGDVPVERYLFLLHSGDGLGGGTEYYNSTVVHTDPRAFWDEDRWRRLLNLLAHEFFHTWNVKRSRPAGIARYDYLAENYTELLWVAEGLTSYYDEMLPVRAGLVDVADYRKGLARAIDAVVDRPGYGQDTLARASFEAWTKGYHRGEDRAADKANRTISFYSQGGLLGLVLDLELRALSDGERSLDDLMRSLYRDFPLGGPGYTYADLRQRLVALGGAALGERLDGWVHGTDPLPLAEALARVGWILEREDIADEPLQSSLGAALSAGDPPSVRRVTLDGAAWRAGVNAGDELLALDGVRIGTHMDDLLRRHAPGDRVELTLFRDGLLRQLDVTLDPRRGDHELQVDEDADGAALALRRDWLGGREED